MCIQANRKFHKFIIITIIVQLEHDSVIHRETALDVTPDGYGTDHLHDGHQDLVAGYAVDE